MMLYASVILPCFHGVSFIFLLRLCMSKETVVAAPAREEPVIPQELRRTACPNFPLVG